MAVAEAFEIMYGGPDVMVLFGDDFQYSSASAYFINLDKLVKVCGLEYTCRVSTERTACDVRQTCSAPLY